MNQPKQPSVFALSLVYCGDYETDVQYIPGALVRYNGTLYLAITAPEVVVQHEQPDQSPNVWLPFAPASS